jgi:hypothetical protein
MVDVFGNRAGTAQSLLGDSEVRDRALDDPQFDDVDDAEKENRPKDTKPLIRPVRWRNLNSLHRWF